MKFDNDFNEVKIRHVVIMFLLVFLISIAMVIILNTDGEISNTYTNALSLFIEVLLSIMLIYKIKPSKEKINLLYRDFKSKLDIKEIVRVIVFFICLNRGSNNIVTDIAYVISPSFANKFINESSMVINSMTDYWIIFIMMVILGPFLEEIIFRNVLFKRLSKKFNIYVGLIVSSIIFSSINIGPQIIGIFSLGIINCLLYVKYENILMPMLIYFIDSLVDMIIFILFGKFGNEVVVLTSNDIVLYGISGVILFTIGIIFFVKFINENKVYLREMNDKSKVVEIN